MRSRRDQKTKEFDKNRKEEILDNMLALQEQKEVKKFQDEKVRIIYPPNYSLLNTLVPIEGLCNVEKRFSIFFGTGNDTVVFGGKFATR